MSVALFWVRGYFSGFRAYGFLGFIRVSGDSMAWVVEGKIGSRV